MQQYWRDNRKQRDELRSKLEGLRDSEDLGWQLEESRIGIALLEHRAATHDIVVAPRKKKGEALGRLLDTFDIVLRRMLTRIVVI